MFLLFSLVHPLGGPVSPPAEIALPDRCVAIRAVGRGGRSPVHTDAVEALLVSGAWRPPKPGDRVEVPGGTPQTWAAMSRNPDASFGGDGYAGGYAYFAVDEPRAEAALLQPNGAALVYVNGEPRVGDVYNSGITRLPILLKAGRNDLLFQFGRDGRIRPRLVHPPAPVSLDTHDTTLPDLRVGESVHSWGAVLVLNATPRRITGARIRAELPNRMGSSVHPVPSIAPFSMRKVPFFIAGRAPANEGVQLLHLALYMPGSSRAVSEAALSLRVRNPHAPYKTTFLSEIDGSVQYYAVNPPSTWEPQQDRRAPALFLTLHGAGVEAIGQAEAYEPKPWGVLVAPTNRRPFGFDWEDWGRLDALEVLQHARIRLHTDPARTYLTGHSMGGHGTWQIGALFPSLFAAIGPSAGWISFQSYAGGARFPSGDRIAAMMARAAASSDTLALARNYLQEGIYILHGAADDNVPVTEAREMVRVLSAFHHDFTYHEQPGAGHWWDASDEPGADCVDWAPMFDLFAHHVIPSDDQVRRVEFLTPNPGISARSHWVQILQQTHPLQVSSVSIQVDPGRRRFTGATQNVERLAFTLHGLMEAGSGVSVELDGARVTAAWPNSGRIELQRRGGTWEVAQPAPPAWKNPRRYGPFKDAFRHHMLFVYGTAGTPEENAWSFAKARYDAETFWYRGNGSVDVVADHDFDPAGNPNRSVILYGNRTTNLAWNKLLGDSPVQVDGKGVTIGATVLSRPDLACLFVRPRPGSSTAYVAAVSGTGLPGMRLTDRLNYFLSGVAYPDFTVLTSEMLARGWPAVRAAGFFGNDWGLDGAEFALR
ncbi:MAG: prolyl oligopeptidase family serine peptidase [Chthonomonadales bacterium]